MKPINVNAIVKCRADLAKIVLEGTGVDITEQLPDQAIVAYLHCNVAQRKALVQKTMNNLKSLAIPR
jgi:hypothetical protein